MGALVEACALGTTCTSGICKGYGSMPRGCTSALWRRSIPRRCGRGCSASWASRRAFAACTSNNQDNFKRGSVTHDYRSMWRLRAWKWPGNGHFLRLDTVLLSILTDSLARVLLSKHLRVNSRCLIGLTVQCVWSCNMWGRKLIMIEARQDRRRRV